MFEENSFIILVFTLKTRDGRQHFMTRRYQPHVVYIVYLTIELESDLTLFVCELSPAGTWTTVEWTVHANLAACPATKVQPAALTAVEYKSDRVAT